MCIFSVLNAPLNTKKKKKIKEALKRTVFTVMTLIRCTWVDTHYGDMRVVVQDHQVDKGGQMFDKKT